MLYLESNSFEPGFNLALEQYLFDELSQDNEIFMLWQNIDSVIVGLHQNTAEEVDRAYLEENNISVVRRLSGGGAVFHDLGNLNYTLITHMSETDVPDISESCKPIIGALLSLGVPVEFRGRNDMTVSGKKFSGNARYYRDGRLMHHGTLLFDVNLDKMANALRVPDDKLVSNSVKSVRSRVTNLNGFLDIPLGEFKERLRGYAAGDAPLYTLSDHEMRSVGAIRRDRYDTWEWNYGRSPDYSIVKHRRIENFGSIRISMSVVDGVIASFGSSGDYFGVKRCDDVAAAIIGVKPERDALLSALGAVNLSDYYEGISAADLVSIIL